MKSINNTNLKHINLFVFIIFASLIQNAYSQSLSFNEALDKAKKENKKVIVDVYTDWCGWCKKMDKETYENSKVKEIMNEFVFVKLNAEGKSTINYNGKKYSEEELAALFQVSGYPTTVFLEPDGKAIEFDYDSFKMNNLPGFYKADDYSKVLDYIKSEMYKTTDLSKIL